MAKELEREFWAEQGLNYLSDKEIQNNNLLLANLIDALLYFDVKKDRIEPYIKLLKERKTKEGYWLPYQGAEYGNGHIFTTTRVLIAMEHYEQKFD